jgi:hypothetical protein
LDFHPDGSTWEVDMRMSNPMGSVKVSVAFAAVRPVIVMGEKKPRCEEAWPLCRVHLNHQHIMSNEVCQCYAAGAACTLKYG